MKKNTKKMLWISLMSVASISLIASASLAASCTHSNKTKQTFNLDNVNNLNKNYNESKTFVLNKIVPNANILIQNNEQFLNSLDTLKNKLKEVNNNKNLTKEEQTTIQNYINNWLTLPEAITEDTSEYASSLDKLKNINLDLKEVLQTHIKNLNNEKNDFHIHLQNIKDKIEEKNIDNSIIQGSLTEIWKFFMLTLVDPDHFTKENELPNTNTNPSQKNTHSHSHAAANLYFEALEWLDNFIDTMNKKTGENTNKDILLNTYKSQIKPLIDKLDDDKTKKEIDNLFKILENSLNKVMSKNSKAILSELDFKLIDDSKVILDNVKTDLEKLRTQLNLTEKEIKFEY